MDTLQHVQKKPSTVVTPKASSGFQSRWFAAQTSPNRSARAPRPSASDLAMQLKRADCFGHQLSQPSSTPFQLGGVLQTKAESLLGAQPLQQQPMEEEEPEQMKVENSAQMALQQRHAPAAAALGPGQSLPRAVRSKMEKSLGSSLADVSIHPNSDHAKSIGALAYTQGNAIHFAPGQYNPDSPSGQDLVGHELVHFLQQRAGRVAMPSQSKGAPINADPSLENEADVLGAKAARGEPVQVPGGAYAESDTESPV